VKKSVNGQQSGPFQLENCSGLGKILLMLASLDFSLPVFLNGAGDCNHDISGPFCHLGWFLSLTDLMVQFIRLIVRVIPSNALLTNGFIPIYFLQV
jgi:hypothetical protein